MSSKTIFLTKNRGFDIFKPSPGYYKLVFFINIIDRCIVTTCFHDVDGFNLINSIKMIRRNLQNLKIK